jgi:hypothetical protein
MDDVRAQMAGHKGHDHAEETHEEAV